MTTAEIAALRELCEVRIGCSSECFYRPKSPGAMCTQELCDCDRNRTMRMAVVASRDAMPAALDEIERLREALGVVLKELKRHSPVCHTEVLGWIVTDLGLDPDAGTK